MKYAFFLLFLSFSTLATTVALPLGGKVSIDTKDWNIQDTNAVTGSHVLMIVNRKLPALQGTILDGNVKDQPQCAQGKTVFCERIVPMGNQVSYQVVGQKFHGKNAYQNYVFAFTFPKTDEQKYLPLLKKFKAHLEFVK